MKNLSKMLSREKRQEHVTLSKTNRGNEASSYLQYIVEHYDNLPEWSIFIHGNEYLHHTIHMSLKDILVNASGLNAGRTRYFGLNAIWLNDTYSKSHAFYKSYISGFWKALKLDLLVKPLPDDMSSHRPCCSQFAVARERILAHPKQFWEYLFEYLQTGQIDSWFTSRYFEWSWHVLFGEPWVMRENMKITESLGIKILKPQKIQALVALAAEKENKKLQEALANVTNKTLSTIDAITSKDIFQKWKKKQMELVQRSQNKFKNVFSLKKEKVYKTKTNKLNVKVKPSLNHSTTKKDGSKVKKEYHEKYQPELQATGTWESYTHIIRDATEENYYGDCSSESEVCKCNGIVRYGKGGSWAYMKGSGSLMCTRENFESVVEGKIVLQKGKAYQCQCRSITADDVSGSDLKKSLTTAKPILSPRTKAPKTSQTKVPRGWNNTSRRVSAPKDKTQSPFSGDAYNLAHPMGVDLKADNVHSLPMKSSGTGEDRPKSITKKAFNPFTKNFMADIKTTAIPRRTKHVSAQKVMRKIPKVTNTESRSTDAKTHSQISGAEQFHHLIRNIDPEIKEAPYKKPYSSFKGTKAIAGQAESTSTASNPWKNSKHRSSPRSSSKTKSSSSAKDPIVSLTKSVITDIKTTPFPRWVMSSSTTKNSAKKLVDSFKKNVKANIKTTSFPIRVKSSSNSPTTTLSQKLLKFSSTFTTKSSPPTQTIPVQRSTSATKATDSDLETSIVKEETEKQFGEDCDPRVTFDDFIPCANGLNCICGSQCKNGGSMQCLAGSCVGMNSKDNVACAEHHSKSACNVRGKGKCEFEIQECGYVPRECEGPITWMTKNWPEHADYYPDFESVTGHVIANIDTSLAATYLFCKDAKCKSFNAKSIGLQPGCSVHKNRKEPMKCFNKG